MTIETFVVLAVVSIAVGFIARRVWRSVKAGRKGAGGCGDDCGCH